MMTTSTVKPIAQNYVPHNCGGKGGYSLSTSSQTQSTNVPLTLYWEMVLPARTAGICKDWRTALQIVCDVNSEYTGIQVTFERNRPRLVFILSLYKSHFFQHPSWMEQLIYLRPNCKQQIYHINKITSQLK